MYSFIQIVHERWCLDESVGQTENGLERGFVKHGLNSDEIIGPLARPLGSTGSKRDNQSVRKRRCQLFSSLGKGI